VNGDRIATKITTPHAIAASAAAAHITHRKRRPRSGLLSVRLKFLRMPVPHKTAMSTMYPAPHAGVANRSPGFAVRQAATRPIQPDSICGELFTMAQRAPITQQDRDQNRLEAPRENVTWRVVNRASPPKRPHQEFAGNDG
jgi:hypothetical protein